MHNSSSLSELLSRFFVSFAGAAAQCARDIFVNGSSKGPGAVARDDVGTTVAELISESNHFLCCGSAKKPGTRRQYPARLRARGPHLVMHGSIRAFACFVH